MGHMRDADTRRVSRPVMNSREDSDDHIPGDHAGGATPVPIPNTEVKPSRADDTAAARLWESRALPGSFEAHGCANPWAFLLALFSLCVIGDTPRMAPMKKSGLRTSGLLLLTDISSSIRLKRTHKTA